MEEQDPNRNYEMCFDCLKRQIESDYSSDSDTDPNLLFSYGISDSSLPFGSAAVVQMENSRGEACPQFVFVYMPIRRDDCLTKYIDEYCLDYLERSPTSVRDDTPLLVINQDQVEVSVATCSDNSDSLENKSNQSQSLSNGGRKTSLAGLGCKSSTCSFSGRFSCSRIITAMAPVARICKSSCAVFDDLSSSFPNGPAEDHILNSLTSMIEGKTRGKDSINFLKLIGTPSFDGYSIPGCIRHPNLAPILGIFKTPSHINFVFPKTSYTLENILHYSPGALKSDWQIKFLIYQLLSALAYMHALGVSHGNISPSSIMLTHLSWCWLCISDTSQLIRKLSLKGANFPSSSPTNVNCCCENCPSRGLYADLRFSSPLDWCSSFNRWWRGEMSNFEYLLVLNGLAGRRWGDYTFYTVMPWVIDFSVTPNEGNDVGWRDLSKSKWRLAKGDEQLDFTYSTSDIPHHVSDECLSELAVCSYKARRLPLSVLRTAVRSVYEPNEYPSTMQRLYQWTPDECIPDFYCNPQIFYSLHSGMSDLAVPSWAGTPDEFIRLHRNALESDRVSGQIHHWIDITFGYKLSGEAAIDAKNVMLPASAPSEPRSVGRRQLFTHPHPARRTIGSALHPCYSNEVEEQNLLLETARLQELEEVAGFCEQASHLSPVYGYHLSPHESQAEEPAGESSEKGILVKHDYFSNNKMAPIIDLTYLLESISEDDDCSLGYQELLLWKQKLSYSKFFSEDVAMDMFSVGCILAEFHLRRPLFDRTSLAVYLESGALPKLVQDLPPQTRAIVEACVHQDWRRRPSVHRLLESPYFPKTVRSAYLFVAPLQLLADDGSRLHYAASFAGKGAFKAMGSFSAEMCAPYCLPLLANPLSDLEAEWAHILLKEFIKSLNPKSVQILILPAVQRILQVTGYSHLKVSLLQDSFVREVWNRIGKQAYLDSIHPLVLSNLYAIPHKTSATAASVLLIGSSEELGAPITVHQTILPLIHCFGKGLCSDGIDVVIRIGGLFGENFVVKQILPLLRNVVCSCCDISRANKPEPVQSWSALALVDCLRTLNGLVTFLSEEFIVKELIEDGNCLYVQILGQTNFGISVLQVAASGLISVCQQIGPDLTALLVLPKLKGLFDELAFSQETANASFALGRSLRLANGEAREVNQSEGHVDLVFLLYPSLASLLGIEKLRQCCATWLLLEQFLLRCHNWKWEYTGESHRSGPEIMNAGRPPSSRSSTTENSPAKMLLIGVGWSIPQSQGNRGARNSKHPKRLTEHHPNPVEKNVTTSYAGQHEPWYWFPSPAASWDGPDFLGRVGGPKDEFPWKIKASIIHSIRAHHGAVRCFSLCQDECTVYTAGVGPGFKGTIQKLNLSRLDCISGYHGHEEVVNDICVLTSSAKVASCDGTIHIWSSQTGKLISVFAEFSGSSHHLASPVASASKIHSDSANMLNFNPLSSGILTTAYDGNLYTCMHHFKLFNKLVVGTGNGCIRFIDVAQGKKLHLWRSDSVESSFPSLISSICSCSSDKMLADGVSASPSWIAAGLSSGICRLLDERSGNIIKSWQAHDGYVTKLAAPEDHLLVSSSLDKTLRIWDLRRDWAPQPTVFRGHSDSISGFSIWGQDIISISRNKIGLSSLSISAHEEGLHHVTPQYLYMADREVKNMSVLSSLIILPFSRLFLVGTEDGFIKICC